MREGGPGALQRQARHLHRCYSPAVTRLLSGPMYSAEGDVNPNEQTRKTLFTVLWDVSCCNFTGGRLVTRTQRTPAAARLAGWGHYLMLGGSWGREKLTSSVTVAQVGEAPHVPQSNAVSDAGEQELVLASPLLPLQQRRLGGAGVGRVALWRRRAVAIVHDGVPVQGCWLLGRRQPISASKS